MWQYIAAGGLAWALSKGISGSEADHNTMVRTVYDNFSAAAPPDATVYADHLEDSSIPNPEGELSGVTRVPDVVLKAGSTSSIIVEVETSRALKDGASEILDQLNDFSTPGYRNVLVVDAPALSDAETFLNDYEQDLSGNVYLSLPDDVTELL